MSQLRQSSSKYERAQVVTFSCDFAHNHHIPEHAHGWDQFVYGCQGVMTVRTASGTWVVPPHRAVWVPAHVPHAITMSGAVTMKTLYLVTGLAPARLGGCCVLNVSPLLRELVLHACQWDMLEQTVPEQGRLLAVLLDQLRVIDAAPLQLPEPRDPRARRVADLLETNPGDQRTLDDLCRNTGASKRTVERLFRLETRMTFGEWRQQLRLLHALRLLASEVKITTVALETGYNSPSAFIAMFRKALGTTPGEYFA